MRVSFAAFALLVRLTAAIAAEETDTVELRIAVADSSRTCEPVAVKVLLTSVSAERQRVHAMFEPEYGLLEFEIVGPGNIRQTWSPMVQASIEKIDIVELAPRQSLVHSEILLYSPGWGIHFTQSGQYQVQARYRPFADRARKVIQSNMAALNVHPAVGADTEAERRFCGNPQAIFLLGHSTCYAIGSEFEDVIHEFPDSAYAPWSYYALGRAWQARALDDWQKQAMFGRQGYNRQLSEKAIGMFETLLKRHPGFPLATEVRYYVAKEMLRLGNRERALKQIEELRKEHPNLRLLQRAFAAIENIRKEDLELTPEQLAAQLP